MPLRTVIFDFNGVLLDDEDVHFRAFARLFAEHGRPLDEAEYYARLLGLNDRGAIERSFGAHAPIEQLLERKATLYAEELGDTLPFYPGAVELIRELSAAMPIAIASGARRAEILHALEGAALTACFATIVSADEAPRGKPAPDVYQQTLVALSCAPADSLVLEDAPNGIRAARAAGVPCIGIAQTQGRDALAEADIVVDGVGALDTEALRRHHDAITSRR